VVGEGLRAPLYRAVDVRDHAAATSSSTVVAVEGVGREGGLLASRAATSSSTVVALEGVGRERGHLPSQQEYLAAVSRARVIETIIGAKGPRRLKKPLERRGRAR
jgi:hypothetical protein